MNNDKNELIRAKIMAVPVSKMGKVNSAFYMRKYCAELAEARERELLTEIERLNTVLEVTDENHGRTTVLAHKALKDLDKAKAEIERFSKPYVPMTDDERLDISRGMRIRTAEVGQIEAAVIKRAGLEIKHD